MHVLIEKSLRRLTVTREDGPPVLCCSVALGWDPIGAKQREGDGKTPEGIYRVCLVKPDGLRGRSLGLDYPSPADAERAFTEGRIDGNTLESVRAARAENRRPPWGSPLGGEIYIHEGGCIRDWTLGCVALNKRDMDKLWEFRDEINWVEIRK